MLRKLDGQDFDDEGRRLSGTGAWRPADTGGGQGVRLALKSSKGGKSRPGASPRPSPHPAHPAETQHPSACTRPPTHVHPVPPSTQTAKPTHEPKPFSS